MKKGILLLLACLMLIPGCSSNDENKVVGKWQNTKDQMYSCEFSADHTGSMHWLDKTGKPLQAPMKWSMVKGEKKVTVEANLGGGPIIGVFDLKDDKLVSPTGTDVYARMK